MKYKLLSGIEIYVDNSVTVYINKTIFDINYKIIKKDR